VKGGIKARIDDTVIDGTIEYKLEQLRNTLLVKG
jgi:F0F1-type ATP synthase delta subunit